MERVVTRAQANEMSDTRRIIASSLWAYRAIRRDNPLFYERIKGGARYAVWVNDIGYNVCYDRQTRQMWAEARGKQNETIKIMIYE